MKNLLFLVFILSTASVKAQVIYNDIVYKGTGCPQGSVSSVISPDGSTLSIIFDQFSAEVPQYDGNNDNDETGRGRGRGMSERNSPYLNHKNCSLSFTAILPPGTRAEALDIKLQARGSTIIDQGVEGNFASILVGYQGLSQSRGNPTVVIQKHWRGLRGPVDDSWTAEPRSVVQLHSGCSGNKGRTIRFDLKNHIKASIPDQDLSKSGLITVDSADLAGLLNFTLKTAPCGSNMSPPRR